MSPLRSAGVLLYGCIVTVPYILETADGDSDMSYEQLLQLTSSSSTGVIAGRGKSRRARASTCCPRHPRSPASLLLVPITSAPAAVKLFQFLESAARPVPSAVHKWSSVGRAPEPRRLFLSQYFTAAQSPISRDYRCSRATAMYWGGRSAPVRIVRGNYRSAEA